MADNYEKSRESIPTHTTPIAIEERGAGTSIFTISNLFTESQCDSIVDYITKNSNLWNECNNKNVNNVECKYLTIHDMINLNVPESKELDSLIFKAVNSALNALYEIRPDFKCEKIVDTLCAKFMAAQSCMLTGYIQKLCGALPI